jgi:hypothetical protein
MDGVDALYALSGSCVDLDARVPPADPLLAIRRFADAVPAGMSRLFVA